MVEKVLNDYEATYAMRHGILRYLSAAGADPSPGSTNGTTRKPISCPWQSRPRWDGEGP